ncbi:hypothetical protein U3516DRAFT_655568 [Neocallimastix sp. 'constans']
MYNYLLLLFYIHLFLFDFYIFNTKDEVLKVTDDLFYTSFYCKDAIYVSCSNDYSNKVIEIPEKNINVIKLLTHVVIIGLLKIGVLINKNVIMIQNVYLINVSIIIVFLMRKHQLFIVIIYNTGGRTSYMYYDKSYDDSCNNDNE